VEQRRIMTDQRSEALLWESVVWCVGEELETGSQGQGWLLQVSKSWLGTGLEYELPSGLLKPALTS
jgi:hypothetical protein